MKHSIFAVLLVALLAMGCTELRQNLTQYQVLGQSGERRNTRVAVTTSDREAVKEIVTGLATQWRLVDRTSISVLPSVIASYSQDWDVTRYPTSLQAYEYQGKIIVDLSQESPEVGEPRLYQARAQQLLNGLQEKFGDRAVIPQLNEVVRHIQQPVPPPPPK